MGYLVIPLASMQMHWISHNVAAPPMLWGGGEHHICCEPRFQDRVLRSFTFRWNTGTRDETSDAILTPSPRQRENIQRIQRWLLRFLIIKMLELTSGDEITTLTGYDAILVSPSDWFLLENLLPQLNNVIQQLYDHITNVRNEV